MMGYIVILLYLINILLVNKKEKKINYDDLDDEDFEDEEGGSVNSIWKKKNKNDELTILLINKKLNMFKQANRTKKEQ